MTNDEHKAEFMATLRTVPKHHIIKALETFTPRIDWTSASKTSMANEYALLKTAAPNSIMGAYGVGTLDLDQLKRRALSRERGDSDWHLRK